MKKAMKGPSSRSTTKPGDSFDLAAYLASVPADARQALQKLRQAIGAAAPRAEEGTSYGLPGFRLDGRPLVCFAAAKHFCSFYPMSPAVIRAHATDLEGYETSKGTIRFPPTRPLPATLVRKLVKARIIELAPARTPVKARQPTKRARQKGKSTVASRTARDKFAMKGI
jgi:uncharacterized protein YdhG (YjbR/CyaY superfamily)